MYPMGYDAFGLPTENFAIKNNVHPAIVTKNNVDNLETITAVGLHLTMTEKSTLLISIL